MIRTFADKDSARLYRRERVGRLQGIEDAARRALRRLDAASSTNDLAVTPSNRLEKMPQFGPDVYSIRVNDQYRIVFRWDAGYAYDVRITDHYK